MTGRTLSPLLPWRVGRKVGRTLYDANDVLIGVMDTVELAAHVVAAVNARGRRPGPTAPGGSHERVG